MKRLHWNIPLRRSTPRLATMLAALQQSWKRYTPIIGCATYTSAIEASVKAPRWWSLGYRDFLRSWPPWPRSSPHKYCNHNWMNNVPNNDHGCPQKLLLLSHSYLNEMGRIFLSAIH